MRRQLRQIRKAVSPALRKQASLAVTQAALSHGLLSRKRRIGFYMPAKGELNCLPMLNRALWMAAECYLPIVPYARQRKLWFSRLGDRPHWQLNKFGIPEYGHRRTQKVRPSDLDVLFLPLLGFDQRGYRMGMGGGYYDASLAFLNRRTRWRKPRLIGLAFEVQQVTRIPADPWDIPLDGVITERKFYRFRNGCARYCGPRF